MHSTCPYYARLFWVLLFCASQGPLATLSAQDTMAEREREAKAAFEAGVEAAKADDYARARAHFQRSRQLVVKASTLLNLAIADFKLGLVDEALFALDAIEAPASGPEHERLRLRARKVRGEVEALRDSVAANPPQVSLTTAQEQPHERAAPVAGPVPDGAPSSAAAATAQTPPETTQTPAPQLIAAGRPPAQAPSLFVPRVLMLVGGALGAGAIGSAIWWVDRNQKVDACHPDGGDVCREEGQIARQQTAAMALTLSLGIAGLAFVTSGSIWLAQRKHDRRVGISAGMWGPSAFGLKARGRF